LVKAHFALGLIGGILGLLMAPLIFIVSVVVAIFGGGGSFLVLTLIGIIAAIGGIVGAVLSRHRWVFGGLTMLLSGVVPLFLAFRVMAFLSLGTTILVVLFMYSWAILLSIGGLVCLVRPTSRSP